jgi:hypothetical protein
MLGYTTVQQDKTDGRTELLQYIRLMRRGVVLSRVTDHPSSIVIEHSKESTNDLFPYGSASSAFVSVALDLCDGVTIPSPGWSRCAPSQSTRGARNNYFPAPTPKRKLTYFFFTPFTTPFIVSVQGGEGCKFVPPPATKPCIDKSEIRPWSQILPHSSTNRPDLCLSFSKLRHFSVRGHSAVRTSNPTQKHCFPIFLRPPYLVVSKRPRTG